MRALLCFGMALYKLIFTHMLQDYSIGFEAIKFTIVSAQAKQFGRKYGLMTQICKTWWYSRAQQEAHHIDGLVQERRNLSALAMEFRLSCTVPSIYAK